MEYVESHVRAVGYRTICIMVFTVLMFFGGSYRLYQWAILPSKNMVCTLWKDEWNTSGIKWAKDCYGPVILQEARLGDRWWKAPLTNEQQWQLRDIWREWETRYRLSLLCFLSWIGFICTLLLWIRERVKTSKFRH